MLIIREMQRANKLRYIIDRKKETVETGEADGELFNHPEERKESGRE